MTERPGHLLANDPAGHIREATAACTRTAGFVAAELAPLGIPRRTGVFGVEALNGAALDRPA